MAGDRGPEVCTRSGTTSRTDLILSGEGEGPDTQSCGLGSFRLARSFKDVRGLQERRWRWDRGVHSWPGRAGGAGPLGALQGLLGMWVVVRLEKNVLYTWSRFSEDVGHLKSNGVGPSVDTCKFCL